MTSIENSNALFQVNPVLSHQPQSSRTPQLGRRITSTAKIRATKATQPKQRREGETVEAPTDETSGKTERPGTAMVGLQLDSRPWLGFDSNGPSFLLSPLNAQAQVVVLAGFLEGVEGAGTVYVLAHETHALAHRNFVVGKFAGG